MLGGFREGRFYASYGYVTDSNVIGIEIGSYDMLTTDDNMCKTFSVVLKLSHFVLSFGFIYKMPDEQ